MENGFDGTAYGYPADKLLKYVMEGAKNRLCESEQLLLLPLEKLTEQKRHWRESILNETDCRRIQTGNKRSF